MKLARYVFVFTFVVLLATPLSAIAIGLDSVAGALSLPHGSKSTILFPCTCVSYPPVVTIPQLGRVFITRSTGPNGGVTVIDFAQVVQKPYNNKAWLLPFVWHLGKAQYALPTDCMMQVTLYPYPVCIPHFMFADYSGLSAPRKIQYSGTSAPTPF
ncbi:hypothetical protein K2X83_01025 [Patescibacteria group bacterium]|nr:hypothetical protein [Patescibacteria group bacterium]